MFMLILLLDTFNTHFHLPATCLWPSSEMQGNLASSISGPSERRDCQVKLWQFKCDVWYWLLSSRDCKRCVSHFIQDLTIDLHYHLKVSLLFPVLPGKEISDTGANWCTAAQGHSPHEASGWMTSVPTNYLTTTQCVGDSCNYYWSVFLELTSK